ncbi:hypothetical protein [Hymenobacter norwichensis]|uniref:hypothetical protein n=1 Tax=Hymenobacter norwichensis TaxID=223903 RepID=UPI0012F8A9AE|nr:hypothetical protein [Hymenobacter norwichensis]
MKLTALWLVFSFLLSCQTRKEEPTDICDWGRNSLYLSAFLYSGEHLLVLRGKQVLIDTVASASTQLTHIQREVPRAKSGIRVVLLLEEAVVLEQQIPMSDQIAALGITPPLENAKRTEETDILLPPVKGKSRLFRIAYYLFGEKGQQ